MLKVIAVIAVLYLLYRYFKNTATTAQAKTKALKPTPEIQPSKPVVATLHLTYTDANGTTTKRAVTLNSYQLGNPAGMSGYCHLRHETRTFRLDRVTQAIDNNTGEIIENLPEWLENQHNQTPAGLATTLKNKHPHHPPVLAHIAKADGSIRAAEIAVIAQHLQTLHPEINTSPPFIRELLAHFPTTDFPAFQYHTQQIANTSRDELLHIAQTASAIVETQKTIHPNEQRALDHLASLVNSAP